MLASAEQPLTHLQRLELSRSSWIPPRLREAATILDQLEEKFRRRRTARVRVRIVALKPAGHVERLALAMVAASAGDAAVTRRDLKRRGFTEDDLDTWGDRAAMRAAEIKAEREQRA